ncbi:MAG: metallophosphoesterase [Lachnospiraceae bacterium]|nr:metallophosphoesterase [Lachnospiraceae bacterium]
MKFIHISDVRLGLVPDAGKAWSDARAQERWTTFQKVIELCNYREVDLLLVSGNLFHRQPLKRELKEVNYLFSTLKHTRVVLIAGNRDHLKSGTGYTDYRWCSQVVFFDSQDFLTAYFPDCNTEVCGFSYMDSEDPVPRCDDVTPGEDKSRIQILIASAGADDRHVPIDFPKLEEAGFDYVALGGEHAYRIWESQHVAYAGALEPTNGADIGPHGCIYGEIEKDSVDLSFVPMAIREYIPIDIEMTSQTSQFDLESTVSKQIEKYGKNNIYIINISGLFDPEYKPDENALKRFGNVLNVSMKAIPEYDLEYLRRIHKNDVIGKFIDSYLSTDQPLSDKSKKALYLGIQTLLQNTEY